VLVDTHAHLDLEEFDRDRDEVITRTKDAGVSCIINPGISVESSRKALLLAEKYRMILAAAGIHPNSIGGTSEEDMGIIAGLSRQKQVVAIGETGLDFYRDRTPREMQVKVFREHLKLARDTGLPVIIHFRQVGEEGIGLVGKEWFIGQRGVFHCFSGTADFALRMVDMGFCIGFDGPLTYPHSDRIETALRVPLERCLIETDSPFLTPQKYRGRRNEPSYVAEVAKKIAEIKNLEEQEVAAVTGNTARELFGIEDR
jgi:TatD DNase family protein